MREFGSEGALLLLSLRLLLDCEGKEGISENFVVQMRRQIVFSGYDVPSAYVSKVVVVNRRVAVTSPCTLPQLKTLRAKYLQSKSVGTFFKLICEGQEDESGVGDQAALPSGGSVMYVIALS